MSKGLLPLVLACSLTLTGCGNILASFESNKIEDDPGVRTLGQQLEDETIETKAIVNISDADPAFDSAHINIVSYNGFVLIVGQVQSEALKARASDIVRDIRNVRRIYNELEVASPSSGMTRTSDTWITAKVKSYLLGNSSTEGSRVKVLTENGTVYLMGLASQAEADRVTSVASDIAGVQRVVKLFEITD